MVRTKKKKNPFVQYIHRMIGVSESQRFGLSSIENRFKQAYILALNYNYLHNDMLLTSDEYLDCSSYRDDPVRGKLWQLLAVPTKGKEYIKSLYNKLYYRQMNEADYSYLLNTDIESILLKINLSYPDSKNDANESTGDNRPMEIPQVEESPKTLRIHRPASKITDTHRISLEPALSSFRKTARIPMIESLQEQPRIKPVTIKLRPISKLL